MFTQDDLDYLAESHRRMLVISPHFDDGVLSVGGLIARVIRVGALVTVATVFSSPPDGPLSAAARAFHERCGLGEDGMRRRAAEDREACRRLGAEPVHLGMREALYRRERQGSARYPEGSAIFGADVEAETAIVERASELIGSLVADLHPVLVLAPLGVGRHIDHEITAQAVRRMDLHRDRVRWFEDLPYALYQHLTGWEEQLTVGLANVPVVMTERSWQAKIAAITAYQSQLSVLWYEKTPWQAQLRSYAERRGGGKPAERLWRPA
jgi:LmbE family N-acetylglucosaminyl deacetylase